VPHIQSPGIYQLISSGSAHPPKQKSLSFFAISTTRLRHCVDGKSFSEALYPNAKRHPSSVCHRPLSKISSTCPQNGSCRYHSHKLPEYVWQTEHVGPKGFACERRNQPRQQSHVPTDCYVDILYGLEDAFLISTYKLKRLERYLFILTL